MRKLLTAALLVLALAPFARAADDPRRLLGEGLKLYDQTSYEKAAASFDEAAKAAAAGGKVDAAVARLDQGNALYRQKKFKDANAAYQDALRTTDLGLQSTAYFNMGNTFLQLVQEALATNRGPEAESLLNQSAEMYERAMLLAPRDPDPKVNYELILRMTEEIKVAVGRAEAALAQGLGLVMQHEYRKAYEFLQGQVSQHELAFAVKPPLKEDFTRTLTNAQKVTGIWEATNTPPPATITPKP